MKADAYAYDGELWCPDCARTLMRELDDAGVVDDETTDTYPQPAFGLESDSLDYCAKCGWHLEHSLTDDGVKNVIAMIRQGNLSGRTMEAILYHADNYPEIARTLDPPDPEDD